MSVKCKFYVQSIERQGYTSRKSEDDPGTRVTSGIKVNLAPVYAPKDANCENSRFWTATPGGQLWMQINNPEAFNEFVEGQEYYLTFDKA